MDLRGQVPSADELPGPVEHHRTRQQESKRVTEEDSGRSVPRLASKETKRKGAAAPQSDRCSA